MKIPFFKKDEKKESGRNKKTLANASIKEYLPIGSVVLLKDGDKRLMIFGIMQTVEDEEQEIIEEYDYIGVPYPEGNMGDDYQYLFMHEDIEKVYFKGYEDNEREEFVERLVEHYKKDME